MARPRSDAVKLVKRQLIARLRDSVHRPGDRFLSNRAVAERFAISYQTADRLIRELVAEGFLERRAASGTYLPGQRQELDGAQLIFHRRARRKASFGARLLRELTDRLDRERINWRMNWAGEDRTPALSLGKYPVIWEAPAAILAAGEAGRAALLLNQRPAPGLKAIHLDSVSVDDFSGGACAAQLLLQTSSTAAKRSILAGPKGDPRSAARAAGFLSVAKAGVVAAPNWFVEGGLTVAGRAVAAGPGGIFCCNDRLAEAVVRWCAEKGQPVPPLVGFDDAPVAQWLELTTMAIPWRELVSAAVDVIRRRIEGDNSTAIAQMVATRPVLRSSTE